MMNAVHPESSMNRPDALPFEPFQDAVAAVDRLEEIYSRNTAFLRAVFREVLEDAGAGDKSRARAYYPAIRIRVETYDPIDTRSSYGHVAEPGIYQTTITQPALFRDYLIEQVGLLLQNHRVVEVGESDSPIPRISPSRKAPTSRASTWKRSSAARPVRRARPGRDRRRHRQRFLARQGRRARRWRLHRAARGLLAAPAAALHVDRAHAFPELRAVHELPVLRRRVLRPRSRPDGQRQPGLRDAGGTRQPHHPARRKRPGRGGRAAAAATDAGLSPGARRPFRYHPGQYRGGPVQRQDHHRPHRRCAHTPG